jgi:hypothetical protein
MQTTPKVNNTEFKPFLMPFWDLVFDGQMNYNETLNGPMLKISTTYIAYKLGWPIWAYFRLVGDCVL